MVEFNFDNSEVQAKLNEFLEKGLLEALAQGLEKACLIIETQAKINCPVDDGQLRQSITHEVDIETATGTIGSGVEYAPYVEVGTGIYSSEGTGRKDEWSYEDAKGIWHTTRGSKPHPYLQPAADSSAEKVVQAFEGLV